MGVLCRFSWRLNAVQLRPDIDAAEQLVIAVATGKLDEVKGISEALSGPGLRV
ncbi:hypothetical protein STENM223S_05733 [Streptomyces tendae]